MIGLISREGECGISPNGPNDVPWGATRVLEDVMKLNYITKFYPPHHWSVSIPPSSAKPCGGVRAPRLTPGGAERLA